MLNQDILARNYTDTEMRALLVDMFAHVPSSRTPFFVRLLRRGRGAAPSARVTRSAK